MTDRTGAIDLNSDATMTDVKNALAALHDAVETKNQATIKNVEQFLHAYEDKAKEVTKQWADKLKAEAEKAEKLEARLADLESATATKGEAKSTDDLRKEREYVDYFEWLKKGDRAEIDYKSLTSFLESKSTLRTDSSTAGGYLVHPVLDSEIRKNIREVSPVRAFARVRPAASKSVEIPRRGKGIVRAAFEGELEEGETGISTYVMETVTCYRQTHTVPASKDMLISSSFDLENEIVSDVAESMADGEGYNFLFGSGVKGPKGIVADARCEVVDTLAQNVVSFEDFANIAGKLKKGQNPAFFMNRETLSKIWQLKGSDGHPIWAPVSMGGATPATIFGYPYNSDMIDLDSLTQAAAGQKPIIFGDLMRGYEIFDLAGMEVIRDDYTQKKKAVVEWTFHRYLTGQVVLPEAIKIMRTKA